MRLVYKNVLLNTVLLLLIATCSECQNKKVSSTPDLGKPFNAAQFLKYDPKKGDKQIDAFMKHLHQVANFNGAILVAKHGKIIYENAFGWANYPHMDTLSVNSKFQLASVTKTITSTAILQLMERGKLKLNQDVRDFFPNFPYPGITIKLLLTHRSGMMNYVYFVDDVSRRAPRPEKRHHQPANYGHDSAVQTRAV
jgi:CubicO group peptidase (beta-lactamase class C family)